MVLVKGPLLASEGWRSLGGDEPGLGRVSSRSWLAGDAGGRPWWERMELLSPVPPAAQACLPAWGLPTAEAPFCWGPSIPLV